ncbi:hypothetical protein [Antarcticimicrobium luteum]|uniref:Uncharacterized protein n=1 Tax=Antarcticimicrobium luteum TaxID=2547397 RepID=A0A4V3AQS5_9RHOB|nr:hypothetical protein [Antarcticimicrobium luteum]TDK43837.1 hypothetical protein E1832_16295 [Antarcticimicrobium luteum]
MLDFLEIAALPGSVNPPCFLLSIGGPGQRLFEQQEMIAKPLFPCFVILLNPHRHRYLQLMNLAPSPIELSNFPRNGGD